MEPTREQYYNVENLISGRNKLEELVKLLEAMEKIAKMSHENKDTQMVLDAFLVESGKEVISQLEECYKLLKLY